MPNAYDFTGDATTFLGLIGVVSTLIIVVTSFRRFFNSPYNIRVKTTVINDDLQEQQNDLTWRSTKTTEEGN